MKINIGMVDKVVRIVVGIALFSLTFLLDGSARWLGVIGIVPLVTGAVGYCPLYSILGLNTCSAKAPAH